MIKTYFTMAFRAFRRQKAFSLINILSLAIGISAALVIYLVVQYDYSFDRWEKNGPLTYRIVSEQDFSVNPMYMGGVPEPLTSAVRKDLAGIAEATHFYTFGLSNAVIPGPHPVPIKVNGKNIFVDSQYFRAFDDYQWLAGSDAQLSQPSRVVLCESRAKIYFPGLTPEQTIGRVIVYQDSIPCTVAGVVKDPSHNTELNFDEFVSLPTMGYSGFKDMYTKPTWGATTSNSQCFIRLIPGIKPEQLEQGLVTLRKKYQPSDTLTSYHLQSLADLHFTSPYNSLNNRQASRATLKNLIMLAAFLVLLGCVNFINLTTAQAGQRAKEIGIRKTMGGTLRQLRGQFLTEAILLTSVSGIVSLLVTPLLLRLFSAYLPAEMHVRIFHRPDLLIFLALLILVIGCLAGFYPALVLSSFNPVQALKNQSLSIKTTTRQALLRKSLMVFQFMTAQIFVIGAFLISNQISFSIDSDLGFKKDAIIDFSIPYSITKDDQATRDQLGERLRHLPGIAGVSVASEPPSYANGWSAMSTTYFDGKKNIDINAHIKPVDTAYCRLFGLKVLAGTYIIPADSQQQVIINETLMHMMNIKEPQQAIGKTFGNNHVAGVVADFRNNSTHNAIDPIFLRADAKNRWAFHIELVKKPSAWPAIIKQIEAAYKETYADASFSYTFFDESIAKMYDYDVKVLHLVWWAMAISTFISSIGLLGLVTWSIRTRTKEIGIRKVLGATMTNLVAILSKEFVKLIVIAFLIAIPLAWWLTVKWLEDFAYRAPFKWWIFPVSGLAMTAAAMLLLSLRTIKAAMANPIDSLRTE